MRNAFRLWLTLASFATATVIAACGGSSDPGAGPSSLSAPSREDDAASAPPAAAVEPTATPDPLYDPSLITPIPPQEPPAGVDAILGGAPDRRAAQAITDSLTAEGFDLSGIEFYVFPLPGADENMLIINVDAPLDLAGDNPSSPSPLDPSSLDLELLLRSLVGGEVYGASNVGRVVFNVTLASQDGALVMTITLPGDTFAATLTDAITDEEAQAQTVSEFRWVDAE